MVLLNIFIMISSNRRVPTLLDLMLTVGLTIAVLVHLAIVQMFNDQVVQGRRRTFRPRWNSSAQKPSWSPTRHSAA